LLEDIKPLLGGEFTAKVRKIERVGAVRALQWAFIGQLSKQPKGLPVGFVVADDR
jgi:hypothetical protein